MIIRIEDIKEVCSKLLSAIDSDNLSTVTETLAIQTKDNYLVLSVTNREYIVKTRIPIFNDETFSATVNASVFLKLMNQLTTDTVELETKDNVLCIKANGKYKLPMIFEGDVLLELPDITIENEVSKFTISQDILSAISRYNSKELQKEGAVSPVQKLYYLDNKGCITFVTGACVTEFNLDTEAVILLDGKLVKLFKLFNDEHIEVTLGEDALPSGAIQTKVRFKTPTVELTSKIISDSNLINSVPCDAIRNMATETYPHSAVINRAKLLEVVNRLMLFDVSIMKKLYGTFTFDSEKLIISDKDGSNIETITCENSLSVTTPYTLTLEFIDLKSVLDSMKDEFITFNFGNNKSIVLQRPGVYNVIPECVI